MLKVINIPLSSDLIRVENPDDLCLKKEGRKEGMSYTWHPFFEVSLIIFNDEPISFLVGGGALII